MSNLDYPISLLEEAAGRISHVLQVTGINQTYRMNQLDGIRRAINMLNDECVREIKKRVKEKGIGKKLLIRM